MASIDAHASTQPIPVDDKVVCRPSIGERVAGSAEGPSLAPMMVGEGASSTFRRGRL